MDDRDRELTDDSPENIAAKLRETFREEAYELVAELESALLELEKAPEDSEVVGRAFRALHTIKGSGAACDLREISTFAHEVESVFDLVRKGKLAVTRELIDLTLKARDRIKALFDECYRGVSADRTQTGELVEAFKTLAAQGRPTEGAKPAVRPPAACGAAGARSAQKKGPGKKATYRIRFRPARDSLIRGVDPVALLGELRRLGQCNVVAQTDAIPFLEEYAADACYCYWDVILTTDKDRNAIEDVFIFVKDSSELNISVIDEEGRLDDDAGSRKLGDILVERGDLNAEDLRKVLAEQERSGKRFGEVLVETGLSTPDKIESALTEQQHVRELQRERLTADEAVSLRVAAHKLDDLVDLVSRLVTVQARLSQTALTYGTPGLVSVAEEVERLTAELRDKTMSIRMLPIGTAFGKFRRLFRDLSKDLGKEIELETEGAETELEKTVIERLNDPLVHLIRNSLDHGIETPAVRVAAGKPRRGTVRLAAVHSGAHVLIEVGDDGGGMDREAIRAKAVEKGMIAANAELPDNELFALIFAPGFSTAKKVTNVSGRGVGLDVVKKAIEALRGTIEISSRKGAGTTITLKLPLTLAIIDGLLVMIGEQHFVLPLSFVKECVELAGNGNGNGRHIANVRGELVPYIRLREQLGIEGKRPAIEQIVITETSGNRVGFVVDHVIGDNQTVIKNLGKVYKNVDGLSGATILGNGMVALILDVPKLVQIAEREELMA
jgi:two-component system chemotaxis sensor kinase CheA